MSEVTKRGFLKTIMGSITAMPFLNTISFAKPAEPTNSKYSGERYKDAYIGINNIAGGNRTGYPCAAEAFAIVVKGLPWENGRGNEEALEVSHENKEEKLAQWAKETGLSTRKPSEAFS